MRATIMVVFVASVSVEVGGLMLLVLIPIGGITVVPVGWPVVVSVATSVVVSVIVGTTTSVV